MALLICDYFVLMFHGGVLLSQKAAILSPLTKLFFLSIKFQRIGHVAILNAQCYNSLN